MRPPAPPLPPEAVPEPPVASPPCPEPPLLLVPPVAPDPLPPGPAAPCPAPAVPPGSPVDESSSHATNARPAVSKPIQARPRCSISRAYTDGLRGRHRERCPALLVHRRTPVATPARRHHRPPGDCAHTRSRSRAGPNVLALERHPTRSRLLVDVLEVGTRSGRGGPRGSIGRAWNHRLGGRRRDGHRGARARRRLR